MTVLVTLKIPASAKKLEEIARAKPDLLSGIIEQAKSHGLIHHRFWASETELLVVDEWPDEKSFQAFFETATEIPGLMEEAGATGPPEISFWQQTAVGDTV